MHYNIILLDTCTKIIYILVHNNYYRIIKLFVCSVAVYLIQLIKTSDIYVRNRTVWIMKYEHYILINLSIVWKRETRFEKV
jgi:hypothetical protein